MMTLGRERRLIALGVTASLVGFALLWTLYLAKDVLLLLYISGVLAIGFSPIVARFEQMFLRVTRRRLPRALSVFLLYLLLAVVVGFMAWIIVPPFVGQVQALWLDLPRYLELAKTTLIHAGLLNAKLTTGTLINSLPSPSVALAGVLGALKSVAGVVVTFITIVVLPYYMLLESSAIERNFIKLFSPDVRPQVAGVCETVTAKVGAWLGGQLLLSGIIGGAAAFSLWLIGVPYFYVFAVLCAIGEAIPIIGPLVASIAAILVAFSVSLETGGVVVMYFVVQQLVVSYVLGPRVMATQVGVSPLSVIVALLVGTALLGFTGALLAVPTAAIAQVLFEQYLARE